MFEERNVDESGILMFGKKYPPMDQQLYASLIKRIEELEKQEKQRNDWLRVDFVAEQAKSLIIANMQREDFNFPLNFYKKIVQAIKDMQL